MDQNDQTERKKEIVKRRKEERLVRASLLRFFYNTPTRVVQRRRYGLARYTHARYGQAGCFTEWWECWRRCVIPTGNCRSSCLWHECKYWESFCLRSIRRQLHWQTFCSKNPRQTQRLNKRYICQSHVFWTSQQGINSDTSDNTVTHVECDNYVGTALWLFPSNPIIY